MRLSDGLVEVGRPNYDLQTKKSPAVVPYYRIVTQQSKCVEIFLPAVNFCSVFVRVFGWCLPIEVFVAESEEYFEP